jgi:hypothetical protein
MPRHDETIAMLQSEAHLIAALTGLMREMTMSAQYNLSLGSAAFVEADDLLRSMGVDWRDALEDGNGRNSSGGNRS